MNLKNRIITIKGKQLYILAGKPTAVPNRTLYLLSAVDEETDYSLWLVEPNEDGEEKFAMWPYEGPDDRKNELIKELLEDFIEHSFDEEGKDTSNTIMDTARACFDRGVEYRSKDEDELAIVEFTKAIELLPDACVYYNRGRSYRNIGEHDLAKADYDKAIELEPEYKGKYILSPLVMFEDILKLSGRSVQMTLREIGCSELVTALKGCDEKIQTFFFNNMSKGGVSMMKREMEEKRPVTRDDIFEAREKIMWIVAHLKERGDIPV